ncbi:MAG: amidohydrolase family protein [Dehalococcoidia bacterium]
MAETAYPVTDADGHVSEPQDLWEHYLDAATATRANAALRMVDHPGGGVSACLEGDLIGEGNFQGGGGFGKTAADMAQAHWNPADMNPGGFDPDRRIKDMNEMGISAAVLYASWCLLANGVRDPELAAAMCRGFNRYLTDFCSSYPDRLFGVAIVPMQSAAFMVDVAAAAALAGHKAVAVRPNMVRGRALHQPYYQRFWATVQDMGLAVGLHPAATTEVQGVFDLVMRPDPTVSHTLADALALPMDVMITLAWLMVSGTLDRFPNVRLGFLECSGSWVTMFLERLDKRVRYGGGPGQGRLPDIKTMPSEIFARQCYVAFESEEAALPRLWDVVGDSMIWASDYPHFDGEPASEAIENIQSVPEAGQRKIMGGNAARLYGLQLE